MPDGFAVVDATGKWVLPGLVDAHTHLGAREEGEGWAGHDTNELTGPVQAHVRVLDAINPADEGFRDALAGGVLAAGITPGSGNPIGGQTVAIRCWGLSPRGKLTVIARSDPVEHPAQMAPVDAPGRAWVGDVARADLSQARREVRDECEHRLAHVVLIARFVRDEPVAIVVAAQFFEEFEKSRSEVARRHRLRVTRG